MEDSMTKKEWETFFTLLDKITNAPGSWKEKKQECLKQAEKHGSDTALEEFAGWFASDD